MRWKVELRPIVPLYRHPCCPVGRDALELWACLLWPFGEDCWKEITAARRSHLLVSPRAISREN